jgi:hypothetical protein
MERMARCRTWLAAAAASLAMWPPAAAAQEHLTIRSDLFFYGDNTEFHNPFREGETIFGAALRLAADADLNDRVRVSVGAFGNQRFGSERSFELARPILALTVTGRRSEFVFGTLPVRGKPVPTGPDREGPHALLPPIQRETLAFDRPYEAGLQWRFNGNLLSHEIWIVWQRLNTPEHRERLDGGLRAALHPATSVSVPIQIHVVHQGGQLYASGPVADSVAAAAGAKVQRTLGRDVRTSLELFGLVSRYVPDRGRAALSRDGVGFFGRAAAERGSWRAHLVAWRGRNFIKDEGDTNYQSVMLDGGRYRGTRDYAEAGLSRHFQLAPGAGIEVSGRLHRIERYYEYSYRVTSTVALSHRLW